MLKLLATSFRKRMGLFDDPATNCYRLFNSRQDGMEGLAIDIYGEYLLIQFYSVPARNMIMDTGDFREILLKALEAVPVAVKGILIKNRMKLHGPHIQEQRRSALFHGTEPPADYAVKQNGVLAYADLMEGQNTGIFLDMREVRDFLGPFYRENNIQNYLNLFCYTSLFSLHALKNGAGHTLNIDLSKSVLKRAKDNFRLNGLPADERDFVYGDAGKWLKSLRKKGREFDFAVFDPPTFSRNRERTFSIKKNYRDTLFILNDTVPGGFVLTSVNSYSVDRDEYLSYHPDNWKLLGYFNESSDFLDRSGPYLKAGLWHCLKK